MTEPTSEFLRELPPQSTLAIRLRCAPHEMESTVPRALERVGQVAAAAAITAAGAAYTRYLEHDVKAGQFALEIGLPVPVPVHGDGEVIASELPGGAVLTLLHEGPYRSLGRSWESLNALVATHGRTASGAPWEAYVIGPESEPDPSKWRTELYQPVVR
jgi:effector-binding domain-containing protein